MSDQNSENPEGLHFYYDRQERLKHAPRQVKDFYAGKMKTPPKGLIKALVATRASKIMFLTLIALTALGFAISLVDRTSNTEKKGGIHYTLKAFSFEEVIYVSVKLDENSGYGKTSDLSILVTAKDKSSTVTEKKTIEGTYDGKECFFRTTFYDYDILEIEAVIQTDGDTVLLTAPVEKQ
ncbi:MAG: hypothetical protein K5930_13730 [Treponemataceae bacterium]|nr:hypothetical protein [Treponemataceae bacterium]